MDVLKGVCLFCVFLILCSVLLHIVLYSMEGYMCHNAILYIQCLLCIVQWLPIGGNRYITGCNTVMSCISISLLPITVTWHNYYWVIYCSMEGYWAIAICCHLVYLVLCIADWWSDDYTIWHILSSCVLPLIATSHMA